MTRSGVFVLLSALLAVPPTTARTTIRLGEVCDESTLLRLVGVDTTGRTALFALDARQEGIHDWLLELRLVDDGEVGVARLFIDGSGREWIGGSTAPGPILAFERCGPGCLQVLEWQADWRPVGPGLEAPESATAHVTRDASGRPWVVLHLAGDRPGANTAVAFVLRDGHWVSAGSRSVRAVGAPAAYPDPTSPGAVVSGTARFHPDIEPEAWIRSLPRLDSESGASVVRRGTVGGYLLSAGGAVYQSSPTGGWTAERALPWARDPRRAAIWRAGRDYWVDRPSGDAVSGFPLLWYDDRDATEGALWLTEGSGPELRVVSRLLRTPSEPPIEHVLRFADGSWLALGPCRSGEARATLSTWTPDRRRWSPVPIMPGW